MSIRAMVVGNAPAATINLKPAGNPDPHALHAHAEPDPALLPTGEAAAPAAQPSATSRPPAYRPKDAH